MNQRPLPATRAPEPSSHLSPGSTAYVLDAFSLIYQVFHALGEMTGPAGQPVAAIHGFVRDVAEIIERRQPDFLVCAFDAPGPTFRHEIYDQYKANRAPMPLDLQSQIPNIQRFLEAMAIPVVSRVGYEADDVLATLARQSDHAGARCYLVTSDKDCRQLINDNVLMYNLRKDSVIDAQAVREQWGIGPEQVVDFQALWGDSTDNIPGVPGIGKKTAARLLAEHGSLDAILASADQLKGKLRENLQQHADTARLSRRLVELDTRVPLEFDWSTARVTPFDNGALGALCQEFGFRGLERRLTGKSEETSPAISRAEYRAITTTEALSRLADELAEQTCLAVDTETTSTMPRWARLVGISLAWESEKAVYIPIRAPLGEPTIDEKAALDLLRPVLENPAIAKVGQNLKYDIVVLRNAGIRLAGVAFDTMVADYLLQPGVRGHGLDDLARRYLQHTTIKITDLIGKGRNQKRMDQVPIEDITPYAAEDAEIPIRLKPQLEQQLQTTGLDQLFETLEMPLIDVLAEMEFNGIRVNTDLLSTLSGQLEKRIVELELEIYEEAGHRFNIGSPKQLAVVLFDELNLPVGKRTKTGPSTDASVLSQLALIHPLPAKVIEYRQQAKLKNTYVDALPELVLPETGRVHTSFRQDVAATGRLSSTDPNLQNIPVRTAEGRAIRAAFLPESEAWRLLCADYSQIELRVLAHYSQDEVLLEAFKNDCDIHRQVAAQVHSVPTEAVTVEMRRSAKAINFGVIYGQSAFGLAAALGIAKDQAADFIDAYFARYPGVDRFMTQVLADCRKNGYVSTISGRRRAVEGVRDPEARRDLRQRTLPERIAINTVIQGSAADLIKEAMIRVLARLRRENQSARLLLQIHDELLFEVPEQESHELADLVREEMESAAQLSVPLKVDIKVGANWAECEPLA